MDIGASILALIPAVRKKVMWILGFAFAVS